MDEKQIAEAMGVTLPEEGGEQIGAGEEPAVPNSQAGQREEDQAVGGSQASGGRLAAAAVGSPNGDPLEPEAAPPEDGDAEGGKEEAAPHDPETEPQTEEQRRENAAQRRRAEQQAAVDKAVEAALKQERERTQGEWTDFFAKAKLKNTMTGAPITTLEEFNEWSRAFEAARLERDLKDGKLTPEALEKVVSENPAVKRAEDLIRREEEARRQQEDAAAKARIDAEIAEIHKLDPNVKGVEDLMEMPNARQFYEYVKRGNSFLDAWYLTNREALAKQTAQAARQQAMSAARSKEHLTATANARGAGAASVPSEEMQLFRLLNPEATEAEIQSYYNKQKR